MSAERSDLGSAASWLRDGLLAGVGIPLAGGCGFCMCGLILFGSPIPGDILTFWFRSTLAGALLGTTAALPLWWAVRALWRVRLAAFALGPTAAGTMLVLAVLLYAAWEGRLGKLDSKILGFAMAFGAVTVGPPWVSYLAVRSRGRSGLGVLAVTPLWAAGWCAALLGIAELLDTVL